MVFSCFITAYYGVLVSHISSDMEMVRETKEKYIMQLLKECDNLLIKFQNYDGNDMIQVKIYKHTETARIGKQSLVITEGEKTPIVVHFARNDHVDDFVKHVSDFKNDLNVSMYSIQTDQICASQYFQSYGYLSLQQIMLQDFVCTSTYQKAILSNSDDFRDKLVLDVGAGSGILSFFAIQAGARKVYAVEASSMAKHAERLIFNNKLHEKIEVIAGRLEEINIPEKVDMIVSEPMGFILFEERMLETYLHAKKLLHPDGKMFPTRASLHIAPFTDASLYNEWLNRAEFWCQENFHGVDLSSLHTVAVKEYFSQPVLDTFDINICLAESCLYKLDFLTASESDLREIRIPLNFVLQKSGEIHGLAFWFDVEFIGSSETVCLSTSPTQPLTHWFQVRCLIDKPLFVDCGQTLSGFVALKANKKQSYDMDIELFVEGTVLRATNFLDLKNPFYRSTGQMIPGTPRNIAHYSTLANSTLNAEIERK
ncbi:histone-arginine methyltransferase CARMER-like protein [Dinothrombium tinctorium]|uniref:type I protein arginine methyltransferase n=1 Tax=Dinothrombium tinctorium TaxID=1965070 RepID=A0A443R576_9ACAR|nr:histone-arginine methyltransferase CARMER-like protein [Dinothrombium tinctorium]